MTNKTKVTDDAFEKVELTQAQEDKLNEYAWPNKLTGLDRFAYRLAYKMNHEGKGLLDYQPSLIFANAIWQAASQHYEREIAALKIKVSYLETGIAETYEMQVLELSAQVNQLREALIGLGAHCHPALSATAPTMSASV